MRLLRTGVEGSRLLETSVVSGTLGTLELALLIDLVVVAIAKGLAECTLSGKQ